MASSLSAYWANFFKAAGFTNEVAMKHALVFSNNRIKPDMLSELDKPSLREMGITLIGDMIAILRYAKKVVEEKSCEKFMVDSEQSPKAAKKIPKVVKKTVVAKVVPKTTTVPLKADSTTAKKIVQTSAISKTKKLVAKKPVPSKNEPTPETTLKKQQAVLKRRADEMDDRDDDEEDEQDDGEVQHLRDIPVSCAKRTRTISPTPPKLGYTVMLPTRLIQKTQPIPKKCQEQKQTVFDRLGNECLEAVNSATETSTTFNVTGLGKDVYKRSPSVFNRLGDKDSSKNSVSSVGILKNGIGNKISAGISKSQNPTSRTCLITTKQINSRTGGTMRADQEQKRMKISSIAKPTKKVVNKIVFNNNPNSEKRVSRSNIGSGKLASEQPASIPAKARLGVPRPDTGSKQVTFSKVTTVTHYKKPHNADVFSRLGY